MVRLRNDLMGQLSKSNYAHVQSRLDLATENNVQRLLGIDVVALREVNGYFSCEFEVTLFRHSFQ